MNITVSGTGEWEPHFWTEGYATTTMYISVDEELPMRYQEGVVIHEIIETYLQFLPHDKVIELTGYIQNGLQQLSKVIPKCFDE